jgi:hypothetical protein
LVNLLVSSVTRVFSVCAVTAYYNECRHRVHGRAGDLLLIIETGTLWQLRCTCTVCNMCKHYSHYHPKLKNRSSMNIHQGCLSC